MIFLLGGFFLALTFSSVSAYEEYIENEGTYVFGVITENTTWTANGNPYIVVGDIIVPGEKTLTIEPGVKIKFDGYDHELEIEGTLKAIGNKNNYITFTSNQENPHNGSWRGIKLEGTSENNEIQYAIIEYASTGIMIDYNCENPVNIKNSIFRDIYQGISHCNGNVSYNDFINVDTAFSASKNCAISNNYISGSRNVFHYPGTETTIYLNNIVNHNPNNESDAWLVYWDGSENLDAKNNYWGTVDEDYLDAHVYDKNDGSGSWRGEVIYKPYADSLLTFDLTGPEDNVLLNEPNGVSFNWNPINGSGKDLSHYQLYIDNGLMLDNISDTSCNYDVSSFTDGYHSWHVEAVNNNGESFKSNNTFGFNKNIATPHTPIANPSGGWYFENQTVTLTASNSDIIRYTLDGNEPTDLSTEYSEPISVEANVDTPVTLKAKAWDEADNSSPIMTETYNFDLSPPEIPIANPVGGVYDYNVEITLISEDSSKIRYTTNESEPNRLSTLYTDAEPISITHSTVLKAKAWDETGNSSEVMTETYYILRPSYHDYYWTELRFPLDSGGYIGSQEAGIMIYDNETEVIRYTIDGTEPTADSEKYTDPISITETATLKAKGWNKNGIESERTFTAIYVIYDTGTYITENINSDVTWTLDNSPYIIQDYIHLAYDNKLTIEPGVEVILNKYFSIYGAVDAVGDENDYIIFRSVDSADSVKYLEIGRNWNQKSNLEYVNFEHIIVSAENTNISHSIFDNAGGYGGYHFSDSVVKNNEFMINTWRTFSFRNNTVFSNNYIETKNPSDTFNLRYGLPNMMFRIQGYNVVIRDNVFNLSNLSDDIGDTNEAEAIFGIENNSYSIKIVNNNFDFDLPENIKIIKNESDMNIDVRNNYWGTANKDYIKSHIYDYYDNPAFGEAYYQPFADTDLSFDLIFPNNHIFNNSNINFQWEEIIGSGNDLSHYQLFIDGSETADNILETNYNYSDSLGNGEYTWYVKAVKIDNSGIIDSNQIFSFDIGNNLLDQILVQPKGDTYIYSQKVSLTFPIEGSIIRYTLDGEEPTESSLVYTEPIKIADKGSTILKAMAWYNGTQSPLLTEEYNINIDPPEIISAGYIEENNSVDLFVELDRQGKPGRCRYVAETERIEIDNSIDCVEAGYYWRPNGCFNGNQPEKQESEEHRGFNFISADGTSFSLIAHLHYLNNGLYKYHVECTDGVDKSESSIEFAVGEIGPVVYPEPGVYVHPQHIHLSAGSAASIHYTLDGNDPICGSDLVYEEPIPISQSTTVKAIACYGDSDFSEVVNFEYSIFTISEVEVKNIGDSNATITWTTSVSSTDNIVQYSSFPPSLEFDEHEDSEEGTSHEVVLTDLSPDTFYYFSVKSTAFEKIANSMTQSFKTSADTAGIRVRSIYWIKNFGATDDTYLNGWKVKFNVTVDNENETNLWLKLADWKSGSVNTISTIGNTKMNTEDEIENAVNVGTGYEGNTPLTISDEDPFVGGIQQTFYVWVKLPQNTAAGTYSTTFGIKTLEPQN